MFSEKHFAIVFGWSVNWGWNGVRESGPNSNHRLETTVYRPSPLSWGIPRLRLLRDVHPQLLDSLVQRFLGSGFSRQECIQGVRCSGKFRSIPVSVHRVLFSVQSRPCPSIFWGERKEPWPSNPSCKIKKNQENRQKNKSFSRRGSPKINICEHPSSSIFYCIIRAGIGVFSLFSLTKVVSVPKTSDATAPSLHPTLKKTKNRRHYDTIWHYLSPVRLKISYCSWPPNPRVVSIQGWFLAGPKIVSELIL